MKRLKISPWLCINCKNCEMACAYGHYQNFRIDKSRVHTMSIGPDHIHVPLLCLQCDQAACMQVCPTQALVRDETLGIIAYKPERCIKCHICVTACPFGNITVNPDDDSIMKCDLCGGQPMCALFCPTHTITYG